MSEIGKALIDFFLNPWVAGISGFIGKGILDKLLDNFQGTFITKVKESTSTLWKWLRNYSISVSMVNKIENIKAIKFIDYEKTMRELMNKYKYNFEQQKGNDLCYSTSYKNKKYEIIISPSVVSKLENNEDIFYVGDIQFDIKINTGCRNIKDDLYDLYLYKDTLNNQLSSTLNIISSISIEFLLNRINNYLKKLKNINVKSLYGKIGDNQIELNNKNIIIYGAMSSKDLEEIKNVIYRCY